jgi:hypothetical protein
MRSEDPEMFIGEPVLDVGQEPRAVPSERMTEQHLGVEPGVGDAMRR